MCLLRHLRSAVCVALFAALGCAAARRNPVVPEVYWIMTASSGPTSGSSISGSAACPSSSTSSIAIFRATRCSLAQSRQQSSHWIAVVRCDDESGRRDWLSTYSTSLAQRRIDGDEMTPAIAHANSSTIHSGRFGATAPRSPGSNRVVRARATASASRRSYGMSVAAIVGFGRPAISATCSELPSPPREANLQ